MLFEHQKIFTEQNILLSSLKKQHIYIIDIFYKAIKADKYSEISTKNTIKQLTTKRRSPPPSPFNKVPATESPMPNPKPYLLKRFASAARCRECRIIVNYQTGSHKVLMSIQRQDKKYICILRIYFICI